MKYNSACRAQLWEIRSTPSAPASRRRHGPTDRDRRSPQTRHSSGKALPPTSASRQLPGTRSDRRMETPAQDDGRPRLLANQDDLPQSEADRSLAFRSSANLASRTGPLSRPASSRTPHIAPHGAEWRQACRDLGIPNESRCHDLPLKRIRSRAKILLRLSRMRHHTGTRARDETPRRLPQMLPKAQRRKIPRTLPLHPSPCSGQAGRVTPTD